MVFTMDDFNRQYVKEHFAQLTPEERREALELLPPEELVKLLPLKQRLAGLSAEQIEQVRQYLDRLAARRPAGPRKSRRKK